MAASIVIKIMDKINGSRTWDKMKIVNRNVVTKVVFALLYYYGVGV